MNAVQAHLDLARVSPLPLPLRSFASDVAKGVTKVRCLPRFLVFVAGPGPHWSGKDSRAARSRTQATRTYFSRSRDDTLPALATFPHRHSDSHATATTLHGEPESARREAEHLTRGA
jgi:hypothetical protein